MTRPLQCLACGAIATDARLVEGLVVHLCHVHAVELDCDAFEALDMSEKVDT